MTVIDFTEDVDHDVPGFDTDTGECAECHELMSPEEWAARHWPHERECPNGNPDEWCAVNCGDDDHDESCPIMIGAVPTCTCDLEVHEHCCKDC